MGKLVHMPDRSHFVCIHCNRLVERSTYDQHHCPMLDALRQFVREFNNWRPSIGDDTP